MTDPVSLSPRARQRLAYFQDRADASALLASNAVARLKALDESLAMRPADGPDDHRPAERDAIEARRAANQCAYDEASMIVAVCERWLAHVRPGLNVVDVDFPPPTTKRGESIDSAVNRVRVEIAALFEERAVIERAPLPREHAAAEIRAAVNDLRSRGSLRAQHDRDTGRATISYNGPPDTSAPQHALILGAIIGGEAMGDYLAYQLPEKDPAGALHPSERQNRLAEIDQKIERAELLEEAYVLESGETIPRRAGIPGNILLGVRSGGVRRTTQRPRLVAAA